MGEFGGQQRLLPYPSHPYLHFQRTHAAVTIVGKYHDRMPVILEKEEEDIWLNPYIDEASQLRPLLKPFPDDKLEEWEVGAKARNPRNDYPEVIEPIKTSKQQSLF